MSNSQPSITTLPGSKFARQVKVAARDLFGATTRGNEIAALADRMEEDVAIVMERRVPGIVIAFVGGIAVGKTTLASLMLESEARRELQRRVGSKNDNTQVCWIGKIPPRNFKEINEEYQAAMPQTGPNSWLLDCPSYASGSKMEREGAQYGLLLADINVLFVDEAQLRAGINTSEITSANGSVIVPVVRKEASSAEWDKRCADSDFMNSVAHHETRLREKLPDSMILPTVVVPRFEIWGATPEEKARAEEICENRLREALRNARLTADTNPRRESMARNQEKAFRSELRRKLGQEIELLREPLAELKRQQQKLPTMVIESLVGSDEVLSAGVRSQILMKAPSKLWMIWFPFRSVTWLLALTAGAWDRLVLAMAGSVPSLALTYFSAVRNVRNLSQMKRQANAAFRPRLERALLDRLRPSLEAVHDVVRKIVSDSDIPRLPITALSRTDIRLHGFDAMKETSASIFTSCLKEFHVPVGWMQLCGLVATSFFGWLIWHPLRSLYHRYLEANAWQEFPTPEASMIFTSILLSVAPVLLVSIVCLSVGMAFAHVNKCVSAITQRHQDATKKLAMDGILKLELANPQVEAARFLLTLASES